MTWFSKTLSSLISEGREIKWNGKKSELTYLIFYCFTSQALLSLSCVTHLIPDTCQPGTTNQKQRFLNPVWLRCWTKTRQVARRRSWLKTYWWFSSTFTAKQHLGTWGAGSLPVKVTWSGFTSPDHQFRNTVKTFCLRNWHNSNSD